MCAEKKTDKHDYMCYKKYVFTETCYMFRSIALSSGEAATKISTGRQTIIERDLPLTYHLRVKENNNNNNNE
jgi:hypothetical protein